MRLSLVVGIALAAPALSSCVFQRLNEGLPRLMGRDIHEAINVLGYPSDQRVIAGDTVYTWSTGATVPFPVTNYSTTTGINGAPFQMTTATPGFVPMSLPCQIQLATNGEGRIINWRWQGNLGGCDPYAQALRRMQ
jgi:hypothetical protein